jgi:hypothetical protein
MPTEALELATFATEAVWLVEAAMRQIDKIKELAPIEAKLEKALQKAFRKEGKLFLENIEPLRGFFPDEQVREAAIPWYTWAMMLAALMSAQERAFLLFVAPIDAAVLESLVLGGYSVWAEMAIEPTFTLAASPGAIEYLQDYGAKLVTKIDETTRGYIKTQVQKALDEGWSYGKTAKMITSRYEDFAVGWPQKHIQSRAHAIAVTEVGNAYSEGQAQVAQYLQFQGLPMEKRWLTAYEPCEKICLPNEQAGWIPLDQPFPSGHMRTLGHPVCRCDTLYQRRGAGRR